MNQNKTGTLRTRREVIRRRRRERQVIVFGVLLIFLATVTFAATSVYQGDAEGPFSQPFVTPAGEFESDVRLACPTPGSVAVDTGEVAVRVLNATGRQGLAGSITNTLEGRGFVTTSPGNWNREYEGTVRIMYGAEFLTEAYTAALHFEDAELVLDTRTSSIIDIVLGEDFEDTTLRPLLSPELASGSELSPTAQCLPIGLVPAEPGPRTLPPDPFEVEGEDDEFDEDFDGEFDEDAPTD